MRLLDEAVEAILTNDETQEALSWRLTQAPQALHSAILPDPLAGEFAPRVVLFSPTRREDPLASTPPADIDEIMAERRGAARRLHRPEGYVIQRGGAGYDDAPLIDLSQIDFEALRQRFEQGRKHTEVEKLRAAISRSSHAWSSTTGPAWTTSSGSSR